MRRDLDEKWERLPPCKPASLQAPPQLQLGPGSRRIPPPFDCGDEKGAIFKLHSVFSVHLRGTCSSRFDPAPVSHLLTAHRPSASALSTPTRQH